MVVLLRVLLHGKVLRTLDACTVHSQNQALDWRRAGRGQNDPLALAVIHTGLVIHRRHAAEAAVENYQQQAVMQQQVRAPNDWLHRLVRTARQEDVVV